MFKQLNSVVFVCLVIHVSFICSVPTAQFSPPTSFSLGNEFTAACSINGIDTSNTYIYYVNFYLNSSSWFNVNKVTLVFGFWIGTPACPTCSPKFASPDDLSQFGLKAAAGQKGIYPQFEIKITPLDSKAYGTYFCSVKIDRVQNDTNPIEYKSKEWQVNSHFGLMPSMVTLVVAALLAVLYYF